jgi:hypothetical protein
VKGTGWLWLMFVGAGLLLLIGGGVIGSPPPFVTDKLAVLVIEESADRGNYTQDQRNVITATDPKSVRATVEAKGGEFQVIDDTIPADKLLLAPTWVQAAFKVQRASKPWIVGATPSRGFSAPVTTEADALAKVGGM